MSIPLVVGGAPQTSPHTSFPDTPHHHLSRGGTPAAMSVANHRHWAGDEPPLEYPI